MEDLTLRTKQQLRDDMVAQLEHHGNSDTVHLLWKGYLAALVDSMKEFIAQVPGITIKQTK